MCVWNEVAVKTMWRRSMENVLEHCLLSVCVCLCVSGWVGVGGYVWRRKSLLNPAKQFDELSQSIDVVKWKLFNCMCVSVAGYNSSLELAKQYREYEIQRQDESFYSVFLCVLFVGKERVCVCLVKLPRGFDEIQTICSVTMLRTSRFVPFRRSDCFLSEMRPFSL